jgi:hypothetical protein
MRLNLPMLRRRLHRLGGRRATDLKACATRTWQLRPGEQATVPPAHHSPKMLERVTALSPWRAWETERVMIEGGKIGHDPTLAHLVENVSIVGSFAYSGAGKEHRGYGQEKLFLDSDEPPQSFNEACLITSNFGSHFFGTYLQYDFPLALLPESGATLISMVTKPFSHAEEYRRLCSVPASHLVHQGFVRKLTMYSDHAENPSKEERYRALRASVKAAFANEAKGSFPGVFIRRGRSGELRLLENEPEVEAELARLGFRIVDPETQSARQIAAACFDAPLVISVEGSQISHAIYTMADRATLLVLQPPNRFSMSYKEFTDRVQMRFAFLVGLPSPQGFRVEIAELKALIDELL